MTSDIKNVQEAIELIEAVYRSYRLDDTQQLARWRSVANVIKGFLDKPEFFIREIVQNADDAKSKEITIKVSECHVEIQNDGEEFTKEQFEALSAIGRSTKRIGDFIGNFGIGFKSVFYYTDEVKLASGYLRWKYKSDTICVPFEDYDCISNVEYIKGTKISFKLKDHKRKEIFLEELKNFPKETILFLRNIEKIRLIIDDECEEISKKYMGKDKWKVTVSKNGSKVEGYFILKKGYVRLSKEESLSFLKQKLRYEEEKTIREHFGEVELSISVSISVPLKNDYEINDRYHGYFYTFLPTQSKTYLPCNIHADFIIEQDRRFIVQTNEFNKRFVEKALELIESIIEYYKNTNSDDERLQVYKWLRKAEFDKESELLAAYLHDAIRKMFESEDLILIDHSLYDDIDRVFFKREEVINADEWLFNYLDKKKTYEYIRRYYGRYQVHPEVIKVLKEHNIEIKEFAFKDILKDLEAKPSLPTELKKLLKFYQAIKDYWLSKPKNDEEIVELISNAKFLLLEDERFTSISSAERPIYYVKSKISEKYLNYARKHVYLLNRELIEEIKQAEDAEEIFNFLEEIGIKELTLRDIEDIIVEEINKNPKNWRILFAELINIQREHPRKLDKLKLPCYTLKNPNEVQWSKPNEIYFSKAFKDILGYDLEVILRFSEDTKFIVPYFLEDDFLELIEGDDIEEKKEIIFRFLEKQGIKQRLEVLDDEDNMIKLPKFRSSIPNADVERAINELEEFIKENNINFDIKFFVKIPLQPFRSNIYFSKIWGYVFGIIDRNLEYQNDVIRELRKEDRDYAVNFSKMILKHWQDYRQFLKLKLIYSYKEGTYKEGEMEFGLSKFGKMLKEECWLLDSNNKPRSPLELFINTEDNQKLGLPVVSENITLPQDLIEFLELDRAPDIEYLLNRLEVAIKRGNREEEIKDLLWKIYLEASRNEKLKNKVKERLKKIPVWKDSEIELIPIEKTCWMSQIKEDGFNKKQQQETILKMITPLKDYYGEKFRDFFVNVLEIPEIIPPKVFVDYYAKLLERTEPLSDAEVAFVLNIYMNADNYGIRNEILSMKLLNMNFQFVPESDIEFYCLDEDIVDNLLPEIKERTLITPRRLKDKNIKGSIYESLFEELIDLGKVSTYRCVLEGVADCDVNFERESLALAIWNYYKDKPDVDTNKIKDLCLSIREIRVKTARRIKIVYELNGRRITKNIDRSAAYDASRNTVYIIDEKAQNRYSALFQIKDVLSKHLTTLKGIDEILSNCFDRPIEYVTEFLLSKGIETIEDPFKDITTSVSLITAKDTLTSQQISETPTEINTTPLPSESDKHITEIEEKSYTTHSTEEDSERVIDQIPEIPSQIEVRADPMLAKKAESSEKEEYLIQEGSFDQKPIETIKSSKQKSDLTKLIDKDAGTFNIFQEVEEKSHEKWKPEYEPSKIDIDKILVIYIKPAEEFDESPKKEIKLIESLPIKLESEGFTGLSPSKRYNTISEEDKKRIGRMGEKLVFLYLKRSLLEEYGDAEIEELNGGSKIVLKRHGQILAEIYWLNHKEDAMKEYDIKLVEKGREKYIEVKSTVGDKNYFEISPNQWKFAASHGNSYYIYMVRKIGTRMPELLILENPHKLWKEGKLEIAADSLRVIISKEIKEKHLRT